MGASIQNLLAAMSGNSGGYRIQDAPTVPPADSILGQSSPAAPFATPQQPMPASVGPQMQQPPSSPPPAPPSGPPASPSPLGPQATGIKGYLANILYNMGEAGKKHVGIPTDYEIQQNQLKLNLEQQKVSADAFEKQSQALFRQQMTSKDALGPITDPQEAAALGLQIGDMVSPKQKFDLYKQKLANQGMQSRGLQAAQIRALAMMSQTSMKAAYLPDGSLGVGLYDKMNNFKGYADNAVVPAAYLEKIHHGQQFKIDADGTLREIPTTSTSAPAIPKQPSNQLLGPQTQTNTQPRGNILTPPPQPGTNPPPNGINAHTVMVDGKPFQGATANDTVYAIDPKNPNAGEVATTRQDAATKGLQITANKVSPVQVRKDQSLANRLADVQRKVGDYADSFDQPLVDNDKMALAYLMDNQIGAGLSIHGLSVNILPGYVQSQLKAKGMAALSDAGMKRYILFNQARESLSGYQQILTNSSRGSDKILELQLEQLPPPLAPVDFARMSSSQFQQNIDLAGQHIPSFPGSAETQQSVKASQIASRQANAVIQRNQNQGDMMDVQIPGQPPGKIHKSQWNNFKDKYPGATQLK